MAGTAQAGRRRIRVAPTMSGVAQGTRALAPVMPAVIVIYLFLLLPVETRPTVFGVNLPIYRIAILIFVPLMLARFGSGRARFILPDWLMVLAAVWTAVSFYLHYGLERGMVSAIGIIVDFGGAYAIGRMAIDGVNGLRRFFILISPGLALAGAELMVESLSGRLLVRPFFQSIFGAVAMYEGGQESGTVVLAYHERMGLLRGYGPFSHPILGGSILVSLFPLWFLGGFRSWPRWLGMFAAFAGLFSMSTAAFLGITVGIALCTIDWGKRFLAGVTWMSISALMILAMIAVELSTNRGVTGLLAAISFDPATAYWRFMIWDYGWQSVLNNPWIGIGYEDWVRPIWMVSPSIDAHWLALAVRNGLPMPAFIILTILFGIVGTALRAISADLRDRGLLLSINLSMVVLLVVSMTVNFFGESNVWFMIFVGILATFGAGVRVNRAGSIVLDAQAADPARGASADLSPRTGAATRP